MNLSLILSNDISLDADGWALIAPFGEHTKSRVAIVNGRPREQKFIQILDNAAADQLLDKENGFFRKMARAIIGIPVYKGHPDLPDHAPETLANRKEKKEVIGVVDEVRKGARGIEGHFNLTPGGADAVENEGCKYPSALWLVLPNGRRGGATLCRPFKLLSVGLTPWPNISGVESLANTKGSSAEEQTEPGMKLIIGFLAGKGLALANAESATETQVLEALEKFHSAQAGAVVALGNENATLAGQITALTNERDAAITENAALQKARAAATVDLAITKGRLHLSERDAQIAALENSNDFAAAAKLLFNKARVARTAGDAQSGKILANEMSDDDVRGTYCDAVEKHMKDTGESNPVKAHHAVMRAFPALAEALKTREESLIEKK